MLYGFSIAYLVAPGTFDSASVVEFIHGVPETVKTAGKLVLAAPFTFHAFNGVRHLLWDSGRCKFYRSFLRLILRWCVFLGLGALKGLGVR